MAKKEEFGEQLVTSQPCWIEIDFSISFTFEGVQGHHTDSTVILGAGGTDLGPTTVIDLPGACVLSWSLSCPFTEDHSSFSVLRFCHNRGQHLARYIRAFKRTVKLRSLHLGNSFQVIQQLLSFLT